MKLAHLGDRGMKEFPGYPSGTTVSIMRPEGNGSSGILAVGEALGEQRLQIDSRSGRMPRPGRSSNGRYIGLESLGTLTLTNVVWYRPPRNWLDGAPWEAAAIQACRPLNDELIARVQPRVILALGGVAFRELTGMAGEKQGITMTRGFVVPALPQYLGLPVVGTYHPSFLRRGAKERESTGPRGRTVSPGGGTQGMNLLGVLIRDIQLAADIARNGPPIFTPKDYILGATLDDWATALGYLHAHPGEMVFYDWETHDTIQADDESEMEITIREPTQFQACFGHRVLVSHWSSDLLPIVRALMELPNPKGDWNGRKFDRPLNRSLGIRCDVGEWHDLMDLAHHVQPDIPRGLQYHTSFVCPEVGPWKHLRLPASPLRSLRCGHAGADLGGLFPDDEAHTGGPFRCFLVGRWALRRLHWPGGAAFSGARQDECAGNSSG